MFTCMHIYVLLPLYSSCMYTYIWGVLDSICMPAYPLSDIWLCVYIYHYVFEYQHAPCHGLWCYTYIYIYVQVCITALTDILCLTDMPLFNWYTSLSEYICAYKHMHISIHWYTLVSIYISLFPTALICFAYDFIYVMANLICFDNLDFRTGISACRITSLFHKREETGESFSTLRPSLVCGNGIGIRARNWNWTLQFQFFLLVSSLEMEFEFWTQFHEIGF